MARVRNRTPAPPPGPYHVAPVDGVMIAAEDIAAALFVARGPGGTAVVCRAGQQPVGVSRVYIPKGGSVDPDPAAGNLATQGQSGPLRLGTAATRGAHLTPDVGGQGRPGVVGRTPVGGRAREGGRPGDIVSVEVDLLGCRPHAA